MRVENNLFLLSETQKKLKLKSYPTLLHTFQSFGHVESDCVKILTLNVVQSILGVIKNIRKIWAKLVHFLVKKKLDKTTFTW